MIKNIKIICSNLIKYIKNIFDYNKSTDKKFTKLDKEYVGSLSFFLTKNKDIDISWSSLDLENIPLEELSTLSEMYAEFILYINEGFLQEDILKILKEQHKNKSFIDKPKNKLFIDNIVFHWSLLHAEYHNRQNKSKQKENSPLIRPISVFNPIK